MAKIGGKPTVVCNLFSMSHRTQHLGAVAISLLTTSLHLFQHLSLLTLQQLPLIHGGVSFQLGRFSGSLQAVPESNEQSGSPSIWKSAPKINRAIALCHDPYQLAPAAKRTSNTIAMTWGHQDIRRGVAVANCLIKLCRYPFWLACLNSSFRRPLFENSAEAISFFRDTVDGEQSTLCLPRALFAAKTSRAFAADGVIFIGIFLPSRSMHAWVIESDSLADPADDIWINYQPVAVLG